MKHFNYVCVSGVLKSVGKLKDVGWFSCCAHVNVGEKRTTISVYATGERARELANFQIGNEVVVRGRVSLNPSGNLQISVEHIREYFPQRQRIFQSQSRRRIRFGICDSAFME